MMGEEHKPLAIGKTQNQCALPSIRALFFEQIKL